MRRLYEFQQIVVGTFAEPVLSENIFIQFQWALELHKQLMNAVDINKAQSNAQNSCISHKGHIRGHNNEIDIDKLKDRTIQKNFSIEMPLQQPRYSKIYPLSTKREEKTLIARHLVIHKTMLFKKYENWLLHMHIFVYRVAPLKKRLQIKEITRIRFVLQ